jgi:hypothetical protein
MRKRFDTGNQVEVECLQHGHPCSEVGAPSGQPCGEDGFAKRISAVGRVRLLG